MNSRAINTYKDYMENIIQSILFNKEVKNLPNSYEERKHTLFFLKKYCKENKVSQSAKIINFFTNKYVRDSEYFRIKIQEYRKRKKEEIWFKKYAEIESEKAKKRYYEKNKEKIENKIKQKWILWIISKEKKHWNSKKNKRCRAEYLITKIRDKRLQLEWIIIEWWKVIKI